MTSSSRGFLVFCILTCKPYAHNMANSMYVAGCDEARNFFLLRNVASTGSLHPAPKGARKTSELINRIAHVKHATSLYTPKEPNTSKKTMNHIAHATHGNIICSRSSCSRPAASGKSMCALHLQEGALRKKQSRLLQQLCKAASTATIEKLQTTSRALEAVRCQLKVF